MEEKAKMKITKKQIGIIVFLVLLTVLVGSYAYWQIVLEQGDNNTITTGCFDFTFEEGEAINLAEAYPISSAEGMENEGYTFTITNTCSITASYQVNLETLTSSTLSSNFVHIGLNNSVLGILANLEEVNKTLVSANESHKLIDGVLNTGESVTYNLREWITESATQADAENKLFNSKIVIIATATKPKEGGFLAAQCSDSKYASYLQCMIINDNGGKTTIEARVASDLIEEVEDWALVNEMSDLGVYAAPDDYGTSYYYRGANTDNNWLIFAEQQWRIIRITGEGTIKLIHYGSCLNNICAGSFNDYPTGLNLPKGQSHSFNLNANANAYVGYMYGTPNSTSYAEEHANLNNSNVKTVLDNWFINNLTPSAHMIADTIFCNDRSLASGNGYGTSQTNYAVYNRLVTVNLTFAPSYICPQLNDQFTVQSSKFGNKALNYPVGLYTLDEYGYSLKAYGDLDYDYWSLTPFAFYSGAALMPVNPTGEDMPYTSDEKVIAPVIALKGNVKATGNGTALNPYYVELTNSDNAMPDWPQEQS